MLVKLREHFEKTPFDQLKAEWEKVEKMGFQGPKAFEYIDYICEFHSPTAERSCLPDGLLIPQNITPNFSGYFFLRNIAI